MIRKFSQCSHQYMLTYFWIEHGMEEKIKEGELSESNIEKVKREFKMHQNAIDFDEWSINHCFQKVNGGEADRAAGTADNGRISS
jgi:hypothetical protein